MATPFPVRYFNSEMRGAPVLSGTTGAFIALLDALLVNGFGQVTATSVTVAGGVATVNLQPSQGFSEQVVVEVAGATPESLNGLARVTAATATSVSFPTSAPDGTATGTITIRVAPVGYEKVFSGPNKAVYRSTDVRGSRFFLRVEEVASSPTVRVRAYESMTDVDTGVGAFPTAAQAPNGGYWYRAAGVDATPIRYDIAADSRFILSAIRWAPAYGGQFVAQHLRGFGDPIALKQGGDHYACALSCALLEAPNSAVTASFDMSSLNANSGAIYVARSFDQSAGSTPSLSYAYVGDNAMSGAVATVGAFPSGVDGELKFSRRYIATDASSRLPRAEIPGVLHVPQSGLLGKIAARDTVQGGGALAGRTLLALLGGADASVSNVYFVDITGPWRQE